MAFIKKYNTYIFIAIVAVLVITDAFLWKSLSLQRKIITVFAVFAALHEIEEKVWPGGFYELMMKKFGIDAASADLGRATLVVSIYWLIILGSAYIFDKHIFLLAITVVLSFFEAFIHTAGIWIHRLKKPYTPGLVTAWCMAIVAFLSIRALNKAGMVLSRDMMIGALLWLLSFACMDAVIISGFGKTPAELVTTIRNQRHK